MVYIMSNGLLSEEDKKIIMSDYWSRLDHNVKLIYINKKDTSNCQYCDIIKQLYNELTGMSEKLSLEEYFYEELDNELMERFKIKSAPVVIIQGKNKGLIKFYGIPSGMEFPSFIETIVKASKGETDLPQEIINEVTNIEKDVNIKVFVTPTCPYCPKMVSTSYMFAMLNEKIDAEAWESIEFPDIARDYGVHAVPKVVINDEVSWEGMVPPDYLLHNIYHAIGHEHEH